MQPPKKVSSDSKIVSTIRPTTVKKRSTAISPPRNRSSLTDNSDEKGNRSQMRSCVQAAVVSNESLGVKKTESKASFDHSTEDRSAEEETKRRTKISAAFGFLPDIPKTFFHVVQVPYKLSPKDKEMDVQFSNSMVVRLIPKSSCLLPYLLVGDQILEVNGLPMMTPEEFAVSVFLQTKGTIRLVRPWNNTHCGDRLPTKRNKDTSYLIVDFYKLPGMLNGFEILKTDKRPEVTSTTPGHRGPHSFMVKDRLLDVDSTPTQQLQSAEIRRRFTRTLSQQNICSFLVERPLSLRSSPNTSLTANRAVKPQPIEMGDDAAEIGAREATRMKAMADGYNVRSILKGETTNNNNTATNTKSDEEPFGGVKKPRRGKKKSNRRSVSIDGRLNKISKLPSDIREGTPLQKVTAKSGIIGFVRNYLTRN